MRKFWIILLSLAAVRLAVMATTPVFDPSEARYAALAANMARTGDFVVPHFTYRGVYQSFDGKPPLVFQAGGVFCRVLGVNEFAVRLFPFLSAALLLAIVYFAVRRRTDCETARLSVLVTASATAFYAAAGLSMTDMSLTCCVAGSLLLYWNFLDGFRWRDALGVAALLGAGMIVKGPVALALFGLPVLADAAVNRRLKGILNWKWLAVAPVFLLVAVPWFVLVEMRNPGSVWYFFYNENFLRFVTHDYGDKYGAGREKFRGIAIVWAFVACLPWTLLPVAQAVRGVRRRGVRALLGFDRREFCLVAAVTVTLFWCLTSRVLLYYLFPMIPLFAVALVRQADREWLRRAIVPSAALSGVLLPLMLAGGMLFSDKMQGAKAPYQPWASAYSYEFYHGTPPEAIQQTGTK